MTLDLLGKRASFLFSPLASQQLDDLKRRTRLTRDSDLLAAALDALSDMIRVVTNGGLIFLKSRKKQKVWNYSPYRPPLDYPHFSPAWAGLANEKQTERRSFSLDEAMLERVTTIQGASRYQSLSDVVRAAIAVLNELQTAAEANDLIILRDKRGVTRPYHLLAKPKSDAAPTTKTGAAAVGANRQGPAPAPARNVADLSLRIGAAARARSR